MTQLDLEIPDVTLHHRDLDVDYDCWLLEDERVHVRVGAGEWIAYDGDDVSRLLRRGWVLTVAA